MLIEWHAPADHWLNDSGRRWMSEARTSVGRGLGLSPSKGDTGVSPCPTGHAIMQPRPTASPTSCTTAHLSSTRACIIVTTRRAVTRGTSTTARRKTTLKTGSDVGDRRVIFSSSAERLTGDARSLTRKWLRFESCTRVGHGVKHASVVNMRSIRLRSAVLCEDFSVSSGAQ